MLAAIVLLFCIASLSIVVLQGRRGYADILLVTFVMMLVILQWITAAKESTKTHESPAAVPDIRDRYEDAPPQSIPASSSPIPPSSPPASSPTPVLPSNPVDVAESSIPESDQVADAESSRVEPGQAVDPNALPRSLTNLLPPQVTRKLLDPKLPSAMMMRRRLNAQNRVQTRHQNQDLNLNENQTRNQNQNQNEPQPESKLYLGADLVTQAPSKFLAMATKDVPEDVEDMATMPQGLVLYVTTFMAGSYPGAGKTWRNVIQTSSSDNPRAKDFTFRVEPAFSRRDGISMNSNTLTGPLTHLIGIKGDLSFSLAVVMQPTGSTQGTADVILARLYANTPDNNGFCLFFRNFAPMAANGTVSADMFVTFGNGEPMRCSQSPQQKMPVTLDTTKKYLITCSKGHGRIRVTLVDLTFHGSYDAHVLLDARITTRESVTFSNREMLVNNNENWNGNLMALGIFDRALVDTDVQQLYSYYSGIFRKMDPEYRAVMESLKEVAKAKACPFDKGTCDACASVQDFTNLKSVLASSETCLGNINAFCAANPDHPTCWCWDTGNPYYATRCKTYRSLFDRPPAPPPQSCPAASEGASSSSGVSSVGMSSLPLVETRTTRALTTTMPDILHLVGGMNDEPSSSQTPPIQPSTSSSMDPSGPSRPSLTPSLPNAGPGREDAMRRMLGAMSDLKNLKSPVSTRPVASLPAASTESSGEGSKANKIVSAVKWLFGLGGSPS
jgi:hypothetical protein